ncbi:MAG: zinc and cadmium transporter [Planctomycetota bacterium]|jgi:zinc and cadmium transporter
MFSLYIYTLISVIAVSLLSLIGVFALSLKEAVLRKYIFLLVSLAAGALLGDAFLHLLPESLESIGNNVHVSLAVLMGILLFFILEKFLHWHHHHTSHEEKETCTKVHPVGKMILLSDSFHNFIDGLIIGVSYLVSIEAGIATTLAVVLHEIPQEISDFGILLHAGYSKVRALWMNFLSALFAIAGALVALLLGSSSETLALWMLPVAAGGFIYIALSDLVPEMHKTKKIYLSLLQLTFVLIGILSMVLLLALE